MNYKQIVQDIIEQYKDSPVDILEIGDALGEYRYLNANKESYIRTVSDIDSMCRNSTQEKNILEIGAFLGAVSISLKEIGYSVYALDIPEFYQSSSLRSLYEKNDIAFTGVNLRKRQLPYESHLFDVVIICEVMEHLNFNPLPVLQEINRVLKQGGYIYIGMPNQSYITNRIKLLLGKSMHNPIDYFFKQLDRDDNMIAGLHWREYTLNETVTLIEQMGFQATQKYYWYQKGSRKIQRFIKALIFTVPSFRPYQVVIGKKVSESTHDFWLTEANS